MSVDDCIVEFDHVLRTLFAPARSRRPTPGDDLPEAGLSPDEKAHVAGLMRVNHVGEICAQALYQGQALLARDLLIRDRLREAGQEETEHLAWTASRLQALGSRQSLLNPLWYTGALSLGMLAGVLGEQWNLGFLAETERQVEAHLSGHLESLPPDDAKSRAVVAQMRDDEIRHAETAVALGGKPLPGIACWAMRAAAKVMTTVAYRV